MKFAASGNSNNWNFGEYELMWNYFIEWLLIKQCTIDGENKDIEKARMAQQRQHISE